MELSGCEMLHAGRTVIRVIRGRNNGRNVIQHNSQNHAERRALAWCGVV